MEKPIILGGTVEQKELAAQELKLEEEKGSKPFPREGYKTPEDLRFIELANQYLAKELEHLGVDFEPISLDKIHLLKDVAWFTKYSGDNSLGKHEHGANNASINLFNIEILSLNENVDARLKRFAVILHEMIHIAGHIKFRIDEDGNLNSYRMGYKTIEQHERKGDELFEGLNEAVVDGMVMHILRHYQDELEQEFGDEAFKKSEKEHLYDYEYYIRMLAIIISDIAEKKGEDPLLVRDRFLKGHFTGEMMHLRDIEKVYGKNGLRAIAKWGFAKDQEEGSKITNKVVKFLVAETEEERAAMVEEILAL